jgi:Holliday junction resolvase RusA-like endonuclease
MEVIRLTQIKIPSINEKYNINFKTGRFFLKPAYREFKKLLQLVCKKTMLLPPYRIQINISTYKDIDNVEKLVIDSLQGNCIDNDRNVLEKYTKKIRLKKGSLESLVVWVETIKE